MKNALQANQWPLIRYCFLSFILATPPSWSLIIEGLLELTLCFTMALNLASQIASTTTELQGNCEVHCSGSWYVGPIVLTKTYIFTIFLDCKNLTALIWVGDHMWKSLSSGGKDISKPSQSNCSNMGPLQQHTFKCHHGLEKPKPHNSKIWRP